MAQQVAYGRFGGPVPAVITMPSDGSALEARELHPGVLRGRRNTGRLRTSCWSSTCSGATSWPSPLPQRAKFATWS